MFPSFIDLTNSLLDVDKPSESGVVSYDSLYQSNNFSITSIEDDIHSYDDLMNEVTQILLIKKVPFEATELDIVYMLANFGKIHDLYLVRQRGQAFVEFKDLSSAKVCYETAKKVQLMLKGFPVSIHATGKTKIVKTQGYVNQPSRYLVASFATETEIITTLIVNKVLGAYGNILKIELFPGSPTLAYVEMEDIAAAIRAKEELDNTTYFKVINIRVDYSNEYLFNQALESKLHFYSTLKVQPQTKPKSNPIIHDAHDDSLLDLDKVEKPTSQDLDKPSKEGSNTVMVKNLPKDITLKQLFRLFSCFGNVMKIKIFFSNPENALVEFQDAAQASTAKSYLNNCPIRGRQIAVSISKNPIIINIPYIPEGHKYLADFSNSKEHRYRIAGSKNCNNIARPSPVLHLSNLCEDKHEDFYIKLFEGCGEIKKILPLKGKSKGMLVEMANTSQAVEVLINFHNYDIDTKFLKVSFSKYHTIRYHQQ